MRASVSTAIFLLGSFLSLVSQKTVTSSNAISLPAQQQAVRVRTTVPPPTHAYAPTFKPQEVSLLFSGAHASERILLTLNNNHIVSLPVTLTVFTASGQSVPLPSVELEPNESRIVELSPILNKAGLAQQDLGYLQVGYSGIFLGLGSQLTLYTQGGGGVDSPRSLSADFSSTQRQAAFWLSFGAQATLALTNMSTDTLTVHMHCGALAKDLVLGGHATHIESMGIQDLVPQALQLSLPTGLATGCELRSEGAISSLRATGRITRNDQYAAPIRFYDASTATSANLNAPGLSTTRDTHLAVYNVTDTPITISPLFREATLGQPKQAELPPSVVAPHESVELLTAPALIQLRSQGVKLANVTIQTAAVKGSLVGALTQIDTNGLTEDIPLRTANVAKYAAGAYPLRWDQDYTNLVTVTNTATNSVLAGALVTSGSVTYALPLQTIDPGKTMVYDVDELRAKQVKDANGVVLPKDAISGKFMWFEKNMGKTYGLMGRNSVTSQINHRRSSFSCGNGCIESYDSYPEFTDNQPMTFTPYGQNFGSRIIDKTVLNSGQVYYTPYQFSNTGLTSSNSGILSFGADPNTSTSFMAIAGNGGTVNTTYVYNYYQPYTDQFDDCVYPGPNPQNYGGTAGVQIPASTQFNYVVNDGPPIGCPPNLVGLGRNKQENRYIADQSGNLIHAAQYWQENVIIVTPNGLGIKQSDIFQQNVNTPDGFYTDYLNFCSSACPTNAQARATQYQMDLLNGTNFTLSSNQFVYSCTANTINGQ